MSQLRTKGKTISYWILLVNSVNWMKWREGICGIRWFSSRVIRGWVDERGALCLGNSLILFTNIVVSLGNTKKSLIIFDYYIERMCCVLMNFFYKMQKYFCLSNFFPIKVELFSHLSIFFWLFLLLCALFFPDNYFASKS